MMELSRKRIFNCVSPQRHLFDYETIAVVSLNDRKRADVSNESLTYLAKQLNKGSIHQEISKTERPFCVS
jgi:dsRNA-specific ribonuclease